MGLGKSGLIDEMIFSLGWTFKAYPHSTLKACPPYTLKPVLPTSGKGFTSPYYTWFHPNRFHLKPSEIKVSSRLDFYNISVALLLMCAIRTYATNSSLSSICGMTLQRKKKEQGSTLKKKYPVSILGRCIPIIQPTKVMWSGFGTTSINEREHMEPSIAGKRYKPICSVDKP